MTEERFSRTAMLLGDDAIGRIRSARAAIFGVGGVGAAACEALARAGVGSFLLIDSDTVAESNINRQLIATQHTLGMPKVLAQRERILSINPSAQVDTAQVFYLADTESEISLAGCTCVLDAVDTVSAKLLIIERCRREGIPLVSCMGAGNKLDPSRFRADDIYKTSVCPLARAVRKELRARGIDSLRVVWSDEPVRAPEQGGALPGSAPWCAPAAGLVAAQQMINMIISGRFDAHDK